MAAQVVTEDEIANANGKRCKHCVFRFFPSFVFVVGTEEYLIGSLFLDAFPFINLNSFFSFTFLQ